jgi:hypothetical protein
MVQSVKDEESVVPPVGQRKKLNPVMDAAIKRRMAKTDGSATSTEDDVVAKRKQIGY